MPHDFAAIAPKLIDGRYEGPAIFSHRCEQLAALLAAGGHDIAAVVFFYDCYAGGVVPTADGYPWRYPRVMELAKDRFRQAGVRVLAYIHCGQVNRLVLGDDAEWIAFVQRQLASLGGFDGGYYDGVAPTGKDAGQRSVDVCMPLFRTLNNIIRGCNVVHSSGRTAPSEAELLADAVVFGEHGEGRVPWSDKYIAWSRGRWLTISSLSLPGRGQGEGEAASNFDQLTSYAGALLPNGPIPLYKMSSFHRSGYAEFNGVTYPADWPEKWELQRANVMLGGGVWDWLYDGIPDIYRWAHQYRASLAQPESSPDPDLEN